MPSIYHKLLIEASLQKVYDGITTQEGLAAWWTPETIARPEINSIAHFPFGPDYFKEMKITRLDSNKNVQWICISGAEEWVGTTISFELLPFDKASALKIHPELAGQMQQSTAENGTALTFHHDDWKGYTPMFAECSYTWGQFLTSLKLFCETGKGRPWPNQHRNV